MVKTSFLGNTRPASNRNNFIEAILIASRMGLVVELQPIQGPDDYVAVFLKGYLIPKPLRSLRINSITATREMRLACLLWAADT